MSRHKKSGGRSDATVTEVGRKGRARADTPVGLAYTVMATPQQGEPPRAAEDYPELIAVDPEHYTGAEEIARGGIGRVMRARDRRLGREVAIKELLAPTPELAIRFEREARVTARLQHPSIITLHEAGRWRPGEPFYSMNLVAGHSLGDELAETRSLADRLALLPRIISVVEALAYAHGRGIIHRDLKPANILVGDFGETVVIDWGLAKDLRADDEREGEVVVGSQGDADLTVDGAVMGTPAYMAPEQARGEPADERTDVYALGAILYRTLGGATPFAGDTADEVIEQVSSRRHRPLSELEPGIPQDLCTIVEKAMAREPAQRYASAVDLAADLNLFRRGQLVGAHDYSGWDILRRWIGRHRALLAVSLAAMVVAAGALTFSFDRVIDERDRAQEAQKQAAAWANDAVLGRARAELETDPLRALHTLAALSPEAGEAHWARARVIALAAEIAGLPVVVHTGADLHDLRFTSDGERIVGIDAEREIFSVPAAGGEPEILATHDQRLGGLRVSADGRWLAVTSADGTIRVLPSRGGPPRILRGHEGMIVALEPFPGADRLVSASMDGSVRLWDLATLEDLALDGDAAVATALSVSRNGRRIAAALGRGGVRVWDAHTGEVIADHDVEGVGVAVAFSPDGERVVAGSDEGLYAVDLPDGEIDDLGVEGGIYSVAFADSGVLAAGGEGREVRLWDAEGETKAVLRDYPEEVAILRFSEGGDVLASLFVDGAIRVWRVQEEPALLMTIPGGRDAAGMILSRDGQRVAALRDGTLRVWSVGGSTEVFPFEAEIQAREIGLDRTGSETVVHGPKGVAIHDEGGIFEVERFGITDAVALDPQRGVLVLTGGGRLRLIRRAGEDLELSGGAHAPVVVSPNNRIAAAPALEFRGVRLWDLKTGEARVLETEIRPSDLSFSADGRWLAASIGSAVWIWDMASGEYLELRAHEDAVRQLVIGPQGRCAVTAADDGEVRLWDVATQTSRVIADERWLADLVAFGACQRLAWIASGGAELWTPDADIAELRSPRALEGIEFSPDGTFLAGFDGRSGLLLWNAETGAAMRIADAELAIEDLAFSPDGTALVTLEPGAVRHWPLNLPRGGDAIRRWLRERVDAEL